MANENLLKAVETGNVEAVKKILQTEKINAATYHGSKSIILATENGHIEILKLLLDSGAKIPRASFWSNSYNVALTALKRAAHNGRADIVRLLLDNGANVIAKDLREGFIESVLSGNIEILKMLLEAGAGAVVNIKDENGLTPLMCAVKLPSEHQEEVIKLLLEAGAHTNKTAQVWDKNKGKSVVRKYCPALQEAERLGYDNIVTILQNVKQYRKKKQ